MSLRAIIYAYLLGGVTFIPLLICAAIAWTIYTSVPVGDPDPTKLEKRKKVENEEEDEKPPSGLGALSDQPKTRKGWLTVRRTFEEKENEGSYVNMMRQFLDARSKDPKRSRPKDMWYTVLKGSVLYLYEDESMTECEAAIQVSSYDVVVYPEGLPDGELFTKRNAICLKPLPSSEEAAMPALTKEMDLEDINVEETIESMDASERKKQKEREKLTELARAKEEARKESFDFSARWFIFVRSCVEMEDWYLSLVHASRFSNCTSTLEPVRPVFDPMDMQNLVTSIDEQPDVIPMRWLNALLGRLFFSFYRTETLEKFIIGRLTKKLSKVKTPSFLQNIAITEVSVGNKAPMLSKPMLKELTKEGDASLEIKLQYRGEVRVTVEATAIINLGQRFKTYNVKLVLAIILRKCDGNLLIKVKRPPSDRIWYAFTQPPDMDIDIEPVVSDRQLKWSMILGTIESRLKEVINESVVLPNMDDIAFFDSSPYLQRGGIWADASRKDHSPELLDKTEGKDKDQDVLPNPPIQKSHSMNDVELDASATPEIEGLAKAETIAAPAMSDASKRKSWFSTTKTASSGSGSVRSIKLSDASNAIITSTDEGGQQDEERGRSPISEPTTRRATSVPATATASSSQENDEPSEVEPMKGADEAPVVVDVHAVSNNASTDQLEEASSSPTMARLRSLSSGANSHSRDFSVDGSMRSPGTASSFLSALKSKDKQALSNTAKEAMKKWSANWTEFRQTHMSGTNNNGQEEPSDNGPTPQPSSFFSFPTKRANYADIRNAVASRRDRDRAVSADSSLAQSQSSNPIDIPRSQQSEESSAGSFKSETPPSSSSGTNTPSTSFSQQSPRGPSLLRRDSHRSAPSPPKISTGVHIDEPPSPEVQAVPIKTQPSYGATMTVPGIHASHRGEVMSMGYSPSPPPPTTPDNKSRAPTITSMYRLFKSPTASGNSLQQQQLTRSSSRSPGLSGEESGTGAGQNEDVEPFSLSGELEQQLSPPTTSRPTPPPLPPRKVTPASSVSTPRATTSLPTPPAPAFVLDRTSAPSSSAASEALKQIASLDENARKSLEGETRSASSLNDRNSFSGIRPSELDTVPEPSADTESDVGQANRLDERDLSANTEVDPYAFRNSPARTPDQTVEERVDSQDDTSPSSDVPQSSDKVSVSDERTDPPESKSVPPPLPPRRPSVVSPA